MYLSSKHQSTGDLGGMRYPNRLLSKYLPLCTCNYPFYSAYNSLNHRVNFGQFKLCTDIEKNPGPSVYVASPGGGYSLCRCYKNNSCSILSTKRNCISNTVGENAGQQCVAMSLCALLYSKITKITSVGDMTQIMIVGIQLYSSLSLLARQSM